MGAWIETSVALVAQSQDVVAPHVGAWIETRSASRKCATLKSLPMWERGLKPIISSHQFRCLCVAPHVGAWIETLARAKFPSTAGRSPCGSVD